MSVPTASFAPISRTGLIWGLSGRQLTLVAVGLAVPAWSVTVGQDLVGALLALLWWTAPITVLAVGSAGGRSFLERTLTVGLFALRKATGQTTARVKIRAATDGARLTIPGAAGDRIHVIDIVAVTYGINAAFVWDAVEQTATAVISFNTEAWDLAGDQDKAVRVSAVNSLCQQITDLPGVVRVATHARTYPADGSQMPTPDLDVSSPVGKFAALEYQEMLAHDRMGRALHRDVLVTITVSAKKAAAEVASGGGGAAGMSAVMSQRVQAISSMLPACGVRMQGASWMGRAQLMGALRLVFDPDAAAWLEANGYELPSDAPIVTMLREQLDHLVTDSAFHRTYWVERPPAQPARAGFLAGMIAGGQIPHTVTQLWEPVPAHIAEKRLVNAESSRATASKAQEWLGRPESTSHAAEGKELERRRQEIELGFSDVEYSIFLTVHASSLEELAQATAWVRSVSLGMSVKVLRGQQWSAFMTAALPLGLGVRR